MTTGQPAADTWCGTCQSWRFDPYCGRDDCPGPQPATKITSWAELLGGLGKVPRYTLAYDSMEPDPDGEWVRYVDCGDVTPAAALDEVATLRAERDDARERLRTCQEGLIAYQHAAERQLGELRARVQQLEQALQAGQDETWAGAVTYVRDMGATIRAMAQRYVANTGMAELATVRAEALEECADGMERAAKKARAAIGTTPPILDEQREAAQRDPLPDVLVGQCPYCGELDGHGDWCRHQ